MKMPHPIPYQGSKRYIAKYILPFIPRQADRLIEPFAGSAAISIAAASNGRASHFLINDVNTPLINLWHEIINDPKAISDKYRLLWEQQIGDERNFYDQVREQFNASKQVHHLLYLLARCVKASVRYNTKGEFNQSPDNRRLGRNPDQMTEDIFAVSNLLRGRTVVTSKDYREVLEEATDHDVIYMDPPYQGTSDGGDPRYFSGISFAEFVDSLDRLNHRKIPFIVSYDGRRGDKIYGQDLPQNLEVHKLEVEAGRSTQSTLLGGDDLTYESVYLSRSLVNEMSYTPEDIIYAITKPQKQLFDIVLN